MAAQLSSETLIRQRVTHCAFRLNARLCVVCAGDGAGMLCAMPDSFLSAVLMDEQSFKLPPLGDYAVGMVG